jgi:hypothetical protein
MIAVQYPLLTVGFAELLVGFAGVAEFASKPFEGP